MSVQDINKKLVYHTQCNLNFIKLSFIDETNQNLADIKVKLSSKYHDFINVFNRTQIDKLSSHRFYDHKIELINDVMFSRCRAYRMFLYKL